MLVYTLKDSLAWENEQFFQALMVVVTEAHSASQIQKAQARHRDAMEKSQFVCNLHWRLPMLVLVGDPDRHALDDAVGRVMMLAVMREARAVVVDVSALIHPEVAGREALNILTDHSNSARVEVHLCGISPILQRELQSKPTDRIFLYDELPKALSRAADVNGLRWPAD
jgi:anti-anti-sigma regulatory factor